MKNQIVASGLVLIKNNKVLLSNDGKDNFFKIPGGKPENKETLEEYAIRELKEETGLNGETLEKLSTMKLEKKPQTGEAIDIYLYHFKGKIKKLNLLFSLTIITKLDGLIWKK